MQIEVLLNALSLTEPDIKEKNVVIIDVLRASSSIVTALHHGAKSIVPTSTLGDAGRIAMNLDAKVFLLGGEKGGVKIDGYHLGMSPLEYEPEVVEKRTIIMHTTNTTATIIQAKAAQSVYVGCFLNARSIATRLLEEKKDVLMICIGDKNLVSLADTLCAGLIIDMIRAKKRKYVVEDGAYIAHALYLKEKNRLTEAVEESKYAQHLKTLGFEADIPYCTQLNTHEIVPYFHQNTLSITAN